MQVWRRSPSSRRERRFPIGGKSLGPWVLSARSRRRANSEATSPWELRFPLEGPGNPSAHVKPNEARFDRQSVPGRRRHVGCFSHRVSRLPRSLSGIQTSRPRPVPSPDSRTGSGAGAKPIEPERSGTPERRARCPGAGASRHRRSYDASGACPGQHSRRGPRATPRRPSSARTSTCTSVQRQWMVTW
jgi:hypothetical protein